MKVIRNNGTDDDNIVQNRFTAYLKTAIAHQKAKYLAGLSEQKKLELSYDEHAEILNSLQTGSEDTYLSDEIGDEQLCHALNKLKERDRIIVFRRAVSGESFVKIALDMRIKHVTVKAIYRRSLEKIRKEIMKK